MFDSSLPCSTGRPRGDGTTTTTTLSRVKDDLQQANLWRLQRETVTPGVQDDIVWQDGQLFLRAERQGGGNGRVYTIACTASDSGGNAVTGTATVKVPKNQ